MRAPDDGWKRPWQELTCPADTRVSAETSEGRPPPGQPLSHTVTGAGLSTDSTARLLPTRPELLGDPPAPPRTCAPLPHLPASHIPSVSTLGAASSQQPGPGVADRDAMHLGQKQRCPGEPASPSASPTQVGLLARTPTGARQAASVESRSEGGGLRARGLCQAGKHVPTRFKRRVFTHGPQRTALESRTADRRLRDGLSRAQCLLCTRSRGGRVCFSPEPATSVGLGEVAACFASGGGRRVGAQGLIGWIERGAYKTFFLSCFLFLCLVLPLCWHCSASSSATSLQRDLPRFFAPGGSHVTRAEPIGVFCRGFAIRTQRLQLRPPGFTSRGHVEPGAVDSCVFHYRPEA